MPRNTRPLQKWKPCFRCYLSRWRTTGRRVVGTHSLAHTHTHTHTHTSKQAIYFQQFTGMQTHTASLRHILSPTVWVFSTAETTDWQTLNSSALLNCPLSCSTRDIIIRESTAVSTRSQTCVCVCVCVCWYVHVRQCVCVCV